MSTGVATSNPTAGSPRIGGQSTHRRRVPELMPETVVPTIESPTEIPDGCQCQCNGYLDYVSETTVNCLGCCTATCHHHHHNNNYSFYKKRVTGETDYEVFETREETRAYPVWGSDVFGGFDGYLEACIHGGESHGGGAGGGYNVGMFILRDYKLDLVKAQRVLSDIDSSMPMRVFEKYSKHPRIINGVLGSHNQGSAFSRRPLQSLQNRRSLA